MTVKYFYRKFLFTLIFLYIALLFLILIDLVDDKKLLNVGFHLSLFAVAVFCSVFHAILGNLNIFTASSIKTYFRKVLVFLVYAYVALVFFFLTDLLDGSKFLTWQLHVGIVLLAVFGSIFPAFLETLRSKDNG